VRLTEAAALTAMLPEVEDFTNIRAPQLDAQPALKLSVLRQLLTHGTWMDAAQ
jgi:hypothetical protein